MSLLISKLSAAPTPQWIGEADVNSPLKRSELIDKSLYFPAPGICGAPVALLGRQVQSFIFVDNEAERDDILAAVRRIRPSAFAGYGLRFVRDAHADLDQADVESKFALWCVFDRLPNRDSDHGPSAFSMVYTGGDEARTYRSLYYPDHRPLVIAALEPYAMAENVNRAAEENPAGLPDFSLGGGGSRDRWTAPAERMLVESDHYLAYDSYSGTITAEPCSQKRWTVADKRVENHQARRALEYSSDWRYGYRFEHLASGTGPDQVTALMYALGIEPDARICFYPGAFEDWGPVAIFEHFDCFIYADFTITKVAACRFAESCESFIDDSIEELCPGAAGLERWADLCDARPVGQWVFPGGSFAIRCKIRSPGRIITFIYFGTEAEQTYDFLLAGGIKIDLIVVQNHGPAYFGGNSALYKTAVKRDALPAFIYVGESNTREWPGYTQRCGASIDPGQGGRHRRSLWERADAARSNDDCEQG